MREFNEKLGVIPGNGNIKRGIVSYRKADFSKLWKLIGSIS